MYNKTLDIVQQKTRTLKKLLFILFLIPLIVLSQEQQEIDSLKNVIANAKHDSTVVNAWIAWDNLIYINDPVMDLLLNEKMDSLCQLNLKKKLNEKERLYFLKSKIFAQNNLGIIAYDMGDIEASLQYHTENIKNREAVNDYKGMSNTYTNIGVIHYKNGDYVTAIEYYTKSLNIDEKYGNKQGAANSLNNIGIINYELENLETAIEYYTKSLELEEELKNYDGIIRSSVNIAVIYKEQDKLEEAKAYFNKGLVISEEQNHLWGIGACLNNLGTVYQRQGELDSALVYFERCYEISKNGGDRHSVVNSLINLASINIQLGKNKIATEYGLKAMKMANELKSLMEIKTAAKTLWEIHKINGNHKEALIMHELYTSAKDSLDSEANQKEVLKQDFKYKYDKQAAADSTVNAEAQKVKDAEVLASKEESKRLKTESDKEKQQKMFLFIGLGLALVFGIFMYNRFQITRKQKSIIEQQKLEADDKNKIIEEQHHEITDSINYAEMIQQSVLPTLRIEDINKEAFVLMIPKDKVSGDFYWLEDNEKYSYYVVADCTGHGIPGAFISMIGTILINEIYNSKNLIYPNEFLDELNRLIKLTLTNKEGVTMKDGMDIAFVMMDKATNEIYYTGANNPLWILSTQDTISNNGTEVTPNMAEGNNHLFEIKADKQPVGKYDDNANSFSLNKIKLNQGDSFYIFTDGYADQFGGPKGKKLMYKPFKNFLLEIDAQTAQQKKETLHEHFTSWKGKLEQIDDVCVIGVRV